MTGANLVPFTLQKQNVVAAVLDELLSFAAVFSVRLQAVDQTSPEPGQELSSADVSLLVQQDASALFAGQVSSSVCIYLQLCVFIFGLCHCQHCRR